MRKDLWVTVNSVLFLEAHSIFKHLITPDEALPVSSPFIHLKHSPCEHKHRVHNFVHDPYFDCHDVCWCM